MAANVEIKARVRNLEALERKAAKLADRGPEILRQKDVFFRAPQGRFKLRSFPEGHGELIYYERPDVSGPKRSSYSIHETADSSELNAVLAAALGVAGTVRKERRLYRKGPTRIHLDRVEDLGDFMELEVVLQPDQDESEGVAIAVELMRALGIREEDLVDGAYFDLLERSREKLCANTGVDEISW